jgi:FtsZ-interacting cell division protein ZipA
MLTMATLFSGLWHSRKNRKTQLFTDKQVMKSQKSSNKTLFAHVLFSGKSK